MPKQCQRQTDRIFFFHFVFPVDTVAPIGTRATPDNTRFRLPVA